MSTGREARSGLRWLVGGFLFCPCHLPLTLAALAALFSGTAIGIMIREHTILAGLLITAVWLLATARGLYLMRAPKVCEMPVRPKS